MWYITGTTVREWVTTVTVYVADGNICVTIRVVCSSKALRRLKQLTEQAEFPDCTAGACLLPRLHLQSQHASVKYQDEFRLS